MPPDPNLENLCRLLKASRHANDDSQIKEDFLSSLVAYLISRPMHWWCIPELREFLFESMILFSTASNDHIAKFKESMNEQLGTCTSCLEQYYKAKKPLYASYVNKFAVDSVARFFDTLDAWDAERTLANLREAQEIYSQTTPFTVGAGETPPIQQASMLSPRTVCALYEVLLCPAFLKRPVIDSLFVEVLIGVQRGHGFLKLANELIEGVVMLMIHSDNEIRKWARRAIESYLSKGKFITPSLFMDLQQPITLIVRILGTQRLGQRQLEDVRRDGYNITDAAIEYWRAFKLLLRSMSPDTISEKFLSTEWKEGAQDMSKIVCGIVWDHLEDEGPFFMGALISLNYLLEKAKGLFWVRAGVGTADQAYGAMKRVAGNQIFEQRMIQIIGMPDRGGTDGGAGSDKFTAEKLKPLFDWFNGVFISFETETIEPEITKHLLGLLLGYFQQPKWSEHCHVGCLDIAIKIINQCYTSDTAMIPFESMNEYGERIIRMAITASSPYSEKVRENTEDLVKFVLEDDGVTLRRSYVEFFSTNDGPLSRGAQLEICHRLWRTVCEIPLEELGTELAGAMLKAYGAAAFVDMIPDDLVRGVEEAKTKLMHHINSSLMIIRQHIISLVTQLCDCSANFFRTLMRIEGVPQVIWKLYCTPDAEVRSATVMFLREAFNEITKVDMIRHFFGDFPSTALEGVTSALTDFVELTNEGCDTLSVVKELFGSLSMLVDRDSDALLPYMATLQHDGDVRLPPELLKEFWASFWTALTSGMNAGVGWSDRHKNSFVIPPILCMLEMAQAMVASYSTFEQLIQNDGAGRDGIWSSQQSYPKLDYQPVKAALDPLSEWMYVTKTKVLQCLVPLICAMLKRVAQARMSLGAEVYDKLMNVATATTKSKLTPVDREDLFIALSMHEPTQPVFVADSDEELDMGASSCERALTTTTQWDETERPTSSKSLSMRQTPLVEIYNSPRKVSSYLKDHVEDNVKSATSSSVADTGAVANLQKSLEGVRVGDRENAIVVEDDEDEFGDIEVLEIDDDWFEAVTRPKSSDQSYSTAQLKQNTSQTYPAIPGQSNEKYPQKDLSYVSNTIRVAPPPGTNRVLPFGKASIASKSRAPTTKAKFTSSKSSKMNALRLEFRHERKAMVGNVNRAANTQTIVDRSKVIPSAPMRPRVNQAEKEPESSADSDSDDNATSGLLELTKQHTAPSIRLLQSKLRQREERRTTRLIEAPSLVRNSLEARNKQMEKEAIRRMRVSPNLEALHKVILSWDITVYGDMPPHASRSMYRRVPDRFDDTQEYADVFQPLLLLEIWQQLMRAREEASESDIIEKCMIESRCNIDDFVDVDMRMDLAYAKGLATEDLVFFANHFGPEFFRTSSSKDTEQKWRCKGFLGKVSSIVFKRDLAHIVVRCCFATDQIYVLNSVAPKTLWRALKLSSLTTAHREYSALKAMEYYDLRDDILKPQPVALPVISDTAKYLCMTKYNVNEPQAEAILGAVQRKNGFTLIQGPPGTGKTKTILGLIGALLSQKSPKVIELPGQKSADIASEFDRPSKLLVCAPSNAAVDEIVKRLKNGIMGERGVIMPKIVRIGTGDAINTSVKDVFLDTLVDKELANSRLAKENLDIITGGNTREQTLEEIRKIKLNLDDLDKQLAKVINDPAATSLLNDCRRASLAKKRQLTVQLDEERDQYQARARDFELAKRRTRERILREADVMCCTLSGSGHEMLGNIGVSFETVIIDEAAQSIEISSLIPLKYDCKRCVLVGDPNQLPPTVLSLVAAHFSYEQSLFVRLQKNAPRSVYLLSIQYRMHPEISAFPSKLFYESRLKDGPDMAVTAAAEWHHVFPPYCFFNIRQGREEMGAGKSLYNTKEADAAVTLLDYFAKEFPHIKLAYRVGVITPYKQQLKELKRRFERRFGKEILEKIDFNTVDGFQGQEKDIIIFSCVRAGSGQGIGFLSDIRRMNVGLTRAKNSLFILGHSPSLLKSDYWGKLIEDAQERGQHVDIDTPPFGHKLGGPIPQNLFLKPTGPPPVITGSSIRGFPKNTTAAKDARSKPAHSIDGSNGKVNRKLLPSIPIANDMLLLPGSADDDPMEPVTGAPMLGLAMDEPTSPPPPQPTPKRKISLQAYKAMNKSSSSTTIGLSSSTPNVNMTEADTSRSSAMVSTEISSIHETGPSLLLRQDDGGKSGISSTSFDRSGHVTSSGKIMDEPPKQKAGPNLFITKQKKRKASDESSAEFRGISTKERLIMESQQANKEFKRKAVEDNHRFKRLYKGSKKDPESGNPMDDALKIIEER